MLDCWIIVSYIDHYTSFHIFSFLILFIHLFILFIHPWEITDARVHLTFSIIITQKYEFRLNIRSLVTTNMQSNTLICRKRRFNTRSRVPFDLGNLLTRHLFSNELRSSARRLFTSRMKLEPRKNPWRSRWPDTLSQPKGGTILVERFAYFARN